MFFKKNNSKVTPLDSKIKIKIDYLIQKCSGLQIIEQLQLLLGIQAFVGINRLYLLKKWKLFLWVAYCVSTTLVLIAFYFLITNEFYGGSSRVHKDACCVEFIIISICSTFLMRKGYQSFFSNLEVFDEQVKVHANLQLTSSVRKDVLLMMFRMSYSCVEYMSFIMITAGKINSAMPMLYLTSIAHDSEQTFYCSLLKLILKRVRLLKAHIAKAFDPEHTNDTNDEDNNMEELSKNVELDTTAIHRAYEQLHKCVEQLNTIISFPMIAMLISSGLSSVVLLKYLLQLVQFNGENNNEFDEALSRTVKAHIVYASLRCFKYTVLVIVPCYYSSITSQQVNVIRTILHDAVTNMRFETIERRKVKTLCQLVHNNDFTYALWGVIRLNMSLPLRYFGICTTYLVIIIQFSKFIDQRPVYEMINYGNQL